MSDHGGVSDIKIATGAGTVDVQQVLGWIEEATLIPPTASGTVALAEDAHATITALVAEIARLTAELSRAQDHARAGADALRSCGAQAQEIGGRLDAVGEEIARLTAELAAAHRIIAEQRTWLGSGEAAKSQPRTDTGAIVADVLACAEAWAPEARVIGNVRADEIAAMCHELAAARAVTADVCRYLDCAASDLLAVVTSLYESRARAISDATAPPATVGGLLATACEGEIVEFVSPDGMYHQAVVAGGRLLSRRWQHALSHSPGDWTLYAFWLDGAYLRLPARLVPAAEADRDPATRSPLLAAAPNLHPDGCHTADPTAPRDCTSDGHHECTSCARFDAAGRAAMGDDPIGGLCGECGGEGVILGGDDGQVHQEEWPCRSCTRGPLPKGG